MLIWIFNFWCVSKKVYVLQSVLEQKHHNIKNGVRKGFTAIIGLFQKQRMVFEEINLKMGHE